jgi:hypothetical protein
VFKRYLLLLAAPIVGLPTYAQYVSPSQLLTIYKYWLEPSPEHVSNYITRNISNGWKLDPKLMENEPSHRSVTWLYDMSRTNNVLMVMTQYNGEDLYNKAAFTTSNRAEYDKYLSLMQTRPFKLNSRNTDKHGVKTLIYKSGHLLYILATEPPDERHIINYTIVIQGINQAAH